MDVITAWETHEDLALFLAAVAFLVLAFELAFFRRRVTEGMWGAWAISSLGLFAVMGAGVSLFELIALYRSNDSWVTGISGGMRMLRKCSLLLLVVSVAFLSRSAKSGEHSEVRKLWWIPAGFGATEILASCFPGVEVWIVATGAWTLVLGVVLKLSTHSKVSWLGFVAVITTGCGFVEWNVRHVQGRLRAEYLRRVQTAAFALDAASLADLSFSSADAGTSAFRRIADQLSHLLRLNSDCAYVYLWTIRDRHIVFVAEGARESEDVPEPSAAYRRATEIDQTFFTRTEPFFAGPFRDPWGVLVSANALVSSLADTRHRCWLAFDFRGAAWLAAQSDSRLLGMALTALTGGVYVSGMLYRRRRAEARQSAFARMAAEKAAETRVLFLAKISHELRTPLQIILSQIEHLEKNRSAVDAHQRVSSVREQGELMLRLVNDLLDLGALDSGEFSLSEVPVDLGRLIRDAVATFQPQIDASRVELNCTVEPTLPRWALADPVRMQQILHNLVSNAVRFTSNGHIQVSVNRGSAGPPGGGQFFEVSVRDTGPGISADELPYLFQPFMQRPYPRAKQGAGLGLSLVAALCKRMGGEVRLIQQSIPGAHFLVRLPLRLAAPPLAASKPTVQSPRVQSVLIVDDNGLVRRLYAEYVMRLGVNCDQAANASEALARVDVRRYDAIVLDLALPDLDGCELAHRLRRKQGGQRIIGVSAHASAFHQESALAAGIDPFLTKPIKLAELARALGCPPVADAEAAPVSALFVSQFTAELAPLAARLATALARREWSLLSSGAHELKNSASVVRDLDLYSAGDALEQSAGVEDVTSSTSHLERILVLMQRWIGEGRRGGSDPV